MWVARQSTVDADVCFLFLWLKFLWLALRTTSTAPRRRVKGPNWMKKTWKALSRWGEKSICAQLVFHRVCGLLMFVDVYDVCCVLLFPQLWPSLFGSDVNGSWQATSAIAVRALFDLLWLPRQPPFSKLCSLFPCNWAKPLITYLEFRMSRWWTTFRTCTKMRLNWFVCRTALLWTRYIGWSWVLIVRCVHRHLCSYIYM